MTTTNIINEVFTNPQFIKNFLIGIYDEGNTSYINSVLELLFHIDPIISMDFSENSVFTKLKHMLNQFTGQSAVSIQFFINNYSAIF